MAFEAGVALFLKAQIFRKSLLADCSVSFATSAPELIRKLSMRFGRLFPIWALGNVGGFQYLQSRLWYWQNVILVV